MRLSPAAVRLPLKGVLCTYVRTQAVVWCVRVLWPFAFKPDAGAWYGQTLEISHHRWRWRLLSSLLPCGAVPFIHSHPLDTPGKEKAAEFLASDVRAGLWSHGWLPRVSSTTPLKRPARSRLAAV